MSLRGAVRAAVIGGAGQMGRRIGAELVLCGCEVTMYDRSKEQLTEAFGIMKAEVDMLHRRGLISADDVDKVQTCITLSDDIEDAVKDADLIVEAVIENLDIKRDVISKASLACPPHAIVTTNTMTCSVTKVAEAAAHPENVVGLRFLYPVYMIEDVEITLALQTDVQAAERIKTMAISMGKKCFFKNPGSETFHRIDPSMYETLQREGAHNRNERLGRLSRKHSKHSSMKKASAPPPDMSSVKAAVSATVATAEQGSDANKRAEVEAKAQADKADDAGDVDVEEEEEEEEDADTLCTICFDAQREIMCYPCGHRCLCMTCAQEVRKTTNKCPICRATVEGTVKVFM